MNYKNQHFVTESYLKAWRDPKTPNGTFVWTVSIDNHSIQRKSPRSLFAEEDFYTFYDTNGNRILELEHKLHDVEDKFIKLRDQKLQKHQSLTQGDRHSIALFISTMFARTKRQKEDNKEIWREYLDYIDSLPSELKEFIKQSEEFKQVEFMHLEQPMPFNMFHLVNMFVPFIFRMNCKILETKTNPGFITSDNPCILFDPKIYSSTPPTIWHKLLSSPSVEVIMPVSPKLAISLEWNGFDGYIDLHRKPDIEIEAVDSVNNLSTLNAEEFIVINQNSYKQEWFSKS